MSALIRLNNRAIWKNVVNQTLIQHSRAIKTSQKNRETATIVAEPVSVKETSKKTKNWVSYGFDTKDEAEDRNQMNASFFFSVTLCIVWGTFIWSYLPDTQMRDWAQREGYLELRRREQAGLPLISPDYIDPALMQLPLDEELGDTEIII